MSIPEMKVPEVLEYLNGRTVATMFVCSTVVAARNLTPQQLFILFKKECARTISETDPSPEGQAYTKGFLSLAPYLESAMKAINAAEVLSSLDSQMEH